MPGKKDLEIYAEEWTRENQHVLYGVKDDQNFFDDLLAAKFELERSLISGVAYDAQAEAESQKKMVVGLGNVVGLGIGEKESAGRSTGRLCVKVYVAKKSKDFTVASEAEVPPDIQGLKTDVVEIGEIEAYPPPKTEEVEALVDRKKYPRPVPAGSSVGHPDVSAGTFGCLVYQGNNIFILSNNHVLANSNQARIGDAIVQPGIADGGENPRDRVGSLAMFVPMRMDGPPNLVDCAIARTTLDQVRPEILQIGLPNRMILAPTRGTAVKKRGRTTELTTNGIIEDINFTVRVSYREAGWALFRNQILIRGAGFSAGGDSGSLIVAHQCNRPVGLLFAGNAGSGTTIANRISVVLETLNVQLV